MNVVSGLVSRYLGVLMIGLVVVTMWSLLARNWMAFPASVALLFASFGWHMRRTDFSVENDPPAPPRTRCPGCRTGCVQCREHIDAPEAA